MANSFLSAALDHFRNIPYVTNKETGIIVKGSDGKPMQSGEYTGPLSALTRSKEAKAENNEARTMLLQSLGNAFGLKGMTTQNNQITFSPEFMNKLEHLLGKDFKREDFGIDKNGVVASGKPLTHRRITAILQQAEIAGKQSIDPNFKLDKYERNIHNALKKMGFEEGSSKKLKEEQPVLAAVLNCIDVLKNVEKAGVPLIDAKNLDGMAIAASPYADYISFNVTDMNEREQFPVIRHYDVTRGEYLPSSPDAVRHYMEATLGVKVSLKDPNLDLSKFITSSQTEASLLMHDVANRLNIHLIIMMQEFIKTMAQALQNGTEAKNTEFLADNLKLYNNASMEEIIQHFSDPSWTQPHASNKA